ncbi:hypothetical protein RFH42_03245 [Acinetobacter rudis]|uniref:hypothetical protein n=1 Tax=Acinetobacter rudis TaxID=632955 RepID=UPI00280D445D|nr:hypothetical protein [Acinetobacter rudis]MDQ8951969.1 hypothetical protein [Acinetobacter rudis]
MNMNILTDIELSQKIHLLEIAVENHVKCKNLHTSFELETARQNLYNSVKGQKAKMPKGVEA